jgi:CDP-diacylglycerol---glycerol-3-phosphate 3-phosphatidyltransferase
VAAEPIVHAAPSPVNVPNALSAGRILLVPLLVAVLVQEPSGSLLAAALFALASLTDILDGHLARSKQLVTELGKVLDPLADKLMVVSVLISLALLDRVSVWVVAVILGREVAVSLLRSRALREGRDVSARPLGKVKMGLQVAMVLVLLAAPDPGAGFVQLLVGATVGVTLLSGADAALAMRRPRRPAWSIAGS